MGCLFVLGGCANLVSGLTAQMANDLADTILNSDDVETVREGVPAYLLLIDSFLLNSPDDVVLLQSAATLNSAFSIFTEEDRAKLLNAKALRYAARAACLSNALLCETAETDYEEFEQRLFQLTNRDVAAAYSLGVAWTGWIQSHSDDWNAIGQLGRVKALMSRVIQLDEHWDNGGPHLYMGGLETLLPASLGGKPDKGKQHFDRALELAEGRYLMTKVVYAEQYARLVFDRGLHDRLLTEVLEADPVVSGMTLTNRMAQARARDLLAESNDYF